MADDRLELALEHHMSGDVPRAETLYRSILETDPEQPDALHFLGILLHQKGGGEAGRDLVKQSLRHAPLRADWHNDLGNMLVEGGQL